MNASTSQTVRGLPLPEHLKTIEIDGVRLAYREHGSGEPVVLVHGSISDLTIWEAQMAPVAERHRVIAYSRRYAWPNDDLAAGQKDTMQPHVEDLLSFLRGVDAYPAHLVGNSWGAFICLRAAIEDPAAVRSLTLEEPPLIPLITGAPLSPAQVIKSLVRHPSATGAVLRFAATTMAPVTKLLKAGKVEESIDRFARGVLGDRAFERLPAQVRAHMLANTSTHIGQFLADGGFAPITESSIASVTTPTLIVTGAYSPALFRRLAALLARLVPDSRSLEVPSASHVMHLQNPAALNAGLLRFLSGITEHDH